MKDFVFFLSWSFQKTTWSAWNKTQKTFYITNFLKYFHSHSSFLRTIIGPTTAACPVAYLHILRWLLICSLVRGGVAPLRWRCNQPSSTRTSGAGWLRWGPTIYRVSDLRIYWRMGYLKFSNSRDVPFRHILRILFFHVHFRHLTLRFYIPTTAEGNWNRTPLRVCCVR